MVIDTDAEDGYFGPPSLDNGSVAFVGNERARFVGPQSIYSNIGGSLNVVAQTDTRFSGPSGTVRFFTGLRDPSLDNGNVAFKAYGIELIEPGIAFTGIYTNVGGKLNLVADTKTVIPGKTGKFTDFGNPSLNAGNVAFRGIFGGSEGIYTKIGDSLNLVAETGTPIPGGTGNFNFFTDPSLDNGNVAFGNLELDSNRSLQLKGIYTNIGGSLMNVIAINDSLDSKTVSSLGFGREALSGNSIAFVAGFSDGSQAIYRADAVVSPPNPVPEPTATLGILAFGAFGAGSVLKRKHKKQKSASNI